MSAIYSPVDGGYMRGFNTGDKLLLGAINNVRFYIESKKIKRIIIDHASASTWIDYQEVWLYLNVSKGDVSIAIMHSYGDTCQVKLLLHLRRNMNWLWLLHFNQTSL